MPLCVCVCHVHICVFMSVYIYFLHFAGFARCQKCDGTMRSEITEHYKKRCVSKSQNQGLSTNIEKFCS